MGKPKKKRAKAQRAGERAVDELFAGVTGFILGAISRESGAAPAALRCCARCGHARVDHCGCGKTCLWQGPEEPGPDGQPRRLLCACAGYESPGAEPQAFCGDGPLGPLFDALGLRGKP